MFIDLNPSESAGLLLSWRSDRVFKVDYWRTEELLLCKFSHCCQQSEGKISAEWYDKKIISLFFKTVQVSQYIMVLLLLLLLLIISLPLGVSCCHCLNALRLFVEQSSWQSLTSIKNSHLKKHAFQQCEGHIQQEGTIYQLHAKLEKRLLLELNDLTVIWL